MDWYVKIQQRGSHFINPWSDACGDSSNLFGIGIALSPRYKHSYIIIDSNIWLYVEPKVTDLFRYCPQAIQNFINGVCFTTCSSFY